jgi:GNAT superfamily N-acetyltransferase
MSHTLDDLVEQTQADGFWLPKETVVVDRPELRFTHTTVPRTELNMVVRIRERAAHGRPTDLGRLVAEVDEAHRTVPSRWLLAPRSQLDGLPARLQAHGWRLGPLHHLRALPVRTPTAPPLSQLRVEPVLDRKTLVDCIRTTELAFDLTPGPLSENRLIDELAAARGTRVFRFVVYDDTTGQPMASAGLNVYPQQGIGFLWGGGTHPDFRHRGAYRALLSARLDAARDHGCSHVAVYAREGTSDPILARLGFERHGTLHIWDRPHPAA